MRRFFTKPTLTLTLSLQGEGTRAAMGLIAAVMLTAACAAPSAGPAPGAIGDTGTQTQAEPPAQKGGTFNTIGLRDLPNLNPWTNPRNNISFFLANSVYETLFIYDYQPFQDYRNEYKISPNLAESWELKGNNTVYTVRLRKNVKWHDGQPFTAQDVKFSYDYLADPANRLAGGGNVSTVASVKVIDAYTVEIATKQPDVEFLDKLTESPTNIMPKHGWDRGDNFEKVENGTGPFKILSNDARTGTIYVANKDYWRPDLPRLDRWRMLPATDDAGRMAAFVAGQNDIVKVASKPQAETVLAAAPNAKNTPFYRDNTSELFLKLDRPPFNDVKVRLALHLTVDRRAMNDTFASGDGLFNPPAINPIRKSWAIPQEELLAMPGWRPQKDEDIAQAKLLLTQAGYTTSNPLSFTIRVDRGHPDRPGQSEMIGEQLRQIGVSAKLQPMESASFQKAFAVDGDYDAAMYTGNAPDNWRQQLYSTAPLNRMPIKDAELDKLIDAQAGEFDPAKRKQAILELQRLMIRQAYVIPTITLVGYALWQPYVHGWVDNQAANVGSMDWGQVWLDQATAPKDRQ
jgi:peptide/nickel transport system substrate-binding protein